MPRLESSSPGVTDSELESRDSSDSESVHTIAHMHQGNEFEPEMVAGNAKRKAESPSGEIDGRAFKTLKTESSDVESSGSDSDDDDDDEDEDDDIPSHPSYVNQSFSIPAMEEPLSERTAPETPAVGPPLHPFLQRTAYQLYRQMYPDSKQRINKLSTRLEHQIIKRVPLVSDRFNDCKPQNVTSFFMQALGDVIPKDQRCEKCKKGRGVYSICVVMRDPDISAATGGACANCWYHRQGCNCSFRPIGPPSLPAKTINTKQPIPNTTRPTPVPVPKPPRHVSQPPKHVPQPPKHVSQPPTINAPSQLHPSYAAALAAGAAAPKPTAVSAPNGAAQGRSLSMDDRVRVWENRYSGMPTEKLMAAQEHLNEWQEDLTTRMMAMNKVVLERLRQREGLP